MPTVLEFRHEGVDISLSEKPILGKYIVDFEGGFLDAPDIVEEHVLLVPLHNVHSDHVHKPIFTQQNFDCEFDVVWNAIFDDECVDRCVNEAGVPSCPEITHAFDMFFPHECREKPFNVN